jgi:hypothetical protein
MKSVHKEWSLCGKIVCQPVFCATQTANCWKASPACVASCSCWRVLPLKGWWSSLVAVCLLLHCRCEDCSGWMNINATAVVGCAFVCTVSAILQHYLVLLLLSGVPGGEVVRVYVHNISYIEQCMYGACHRCYLLVVSPHTVGWRTLAVWAEVSIVCGWLSWLPGTVPVNAAWVCGG